MKKIYLLVILLVAGLSIIKAQSLEDIRKFILLRQYQKGKDEVDKFLNNSSNATKAEAWYYKAFVYNILSRDSNMSVLQSGNLNQESFIALKKYKELDPKEPLTKEENNATLFNVYYAYYDQALKAYNGKDYAQSFTSFSNALNVHDYIAGNNVIGDKSTKFSALDTNVVFNLIIIGNELKKNDELVPFYKRLADANVNDTKYVEVYEGIVMYYKKTRNQAAFAEYLEKGKKYYPKDTFWEDIEIENAVEGLEKEQLFKKYDEMLVKYPNNFALLFNYGNELNRYVYSDETKTGDINTFKAKIPDLFKKAIAINSTIDANMLLASFFYNNSYDLTEESKKIKGTKPEDVKKRTELVNASKNNLMMCIPVAEEAVKLFAAKPKLKGSEKINYKLALDMLSTIYKINGDQKKSDEYGKKKADVDKL